MGCIKACREWQRARGTREPFLFDGQDLVEVISRMTLIPSVNAREGMKEGEYDEEIGDFSLGFLGEVAAVVEFLGWAPGRGDAIRAVSVGSGGVDANPLLLPYAERAG